METDFKTLANKVIDTNRLPSKKKAIVFSLCLFIALIFWMLIKFSKEFQLTVLCPVSFVNLPTDKVLMSNADTTFSITIKSQGFNLLYYQLFKKKNVLKIDAALLKFNANDTISYLDATQLTKLASKQFDFNYEIVNILPDVFALRWERALMKRVAVKLNLTIDYQKKFQLYDSITIEPDTISVSGTKFDLEQIKCFSTKKIVLNNVSCTQNLFVDIVQPVNLTKIKLFTPKIKICIPVEKFTETEIEVPIHILDVNNIKLFPEKVKITYQVALKDFKKANQEMFVAVANISKSKTNKNFNAKVELIKFPSFVKISKIYPEKIEYIIFK